MVSGVCIMCISSLISLLALHIIPLNSDLVLDNLPHNKDLTCNVTLIISLKRWKI